ncbi:hypothetical protein EXA20_17630, partial [Vibrio cincinnatiensis]|nr:hypothetical protein [Vibrio cincinnatiensis]
KSPLGWRFDLIIRARRLECGVYDALTKYECNLSFRKIASCSKVNLSTISEILTRFDQSSISWPLPENYSDIELSQALYRDKTTKPTSFLYHRSES